MSVTFDLQTLALSYDELASGKEAFRVAVGNFMNAFFLYNVETRQELLDTPIQMPEPPSSEQRGWAAFCAGAAEYLADRYDLLCPPWTQNPAYSMSEPWYHPACEEFPGLRKSFEEKTPAPFKKRNVLCGDRVFSNPHRSSREPGDYLDMQRRRLEMLQVMAPAERETYILKHNSYMPGELHLSI